MPRSLALWLHLLNRRGGAPLQAGSQLAGPRPAGALICMHAAAPEAEPAAAQLARTLLRLRPDVAIVVTGAQGNATLPEQVLVAEAPDNTVAGTRAFLAHWRPELVLLVGTPAPKALPTALIAETDAALMLVEARFGTVASGNWLSRSWSRLILRALLARFRRILVPDLASVPSLGRLGVARDRVEISGSIREAARPLPCTEAERAALAGLLRSRPVWFAAAVPEAEEAVVLDAQEKALMRAHRTLLILLPERPERAAAIAAAVEARGHGVARRALEQEPHDDVQVLVVDDEGELGLWYRLAPVSWMGGTLQAGQNPRSPLEPAALGSAIVHGPIVAPHAADYARLAEAGACRVVATSGALADVVSELIAPDRVAALAHNAWAVISGDAEVADRVARQVLGELDAAAAHRAGAI